MLESGTPTLVSRSGFPVVMKPARLAVLGIAILAGGAAALMMSGGDPPPPPPQPVAAPAPKTIDVLVASADLPMGQSLKPADLRWQPWPEETVSAGMIKRTESPNALAETTGSLARASILNGEPIRRERLIKTDGTGFMSAILPAGSRAVAISIDNRGSTSAGGFILPNDRVDIIRTYRDEDASKSGGADVHSAETILSGIRVLAIGQNIQERNGEKVVSGETATLELTPQQAELVTLAQKTGQLSLVLRSLADAKQTEPSRDDRKQNALTIVRFGVSKQVPNR